VQPCAVDSIHFPVLDSDQRQRRSTSNQLP
jgi:hypothetical protein